MTVGDLLDDDEDSGDMFDYEDEPSPVIQRPSPPFPQKPSGPPRTGRNLRVKPLPPSVVSRNPDVMTMLVTTYAGKHTLYVNPK